MRITLTLPQVGPVHPGQGGLESLVVGWAAELARRGLDVTVASLSADGGEHRRHCDDGYQLVEARTVADLPRAADLLVANNRPHHLSCALSGPRSVLFMHNSPAPSADNAVRVATPWPPAGRWDPRGATLIRPGSYVDSLRSVDGPWTLVACSAWLARRIQGLTGACVSVVHPHVDTSFAAAIRGPRCNPPVLLYSGRLVWRKGLPDLVGLSLAGKLPGRLLVTDEDDGFGSDTPWIRAMLLAAGVSLISRRRSPVTMAALMASVDAVLVPSSDEPFGMVSLEARAAGTPVVAYRSGGLAETAGANSTGLYLADQGDALGFAEMASRAVNGGPLSDDVRAQVAREFSVGRAVDRLLSIAQAGSV